MKVWVDSSKRENINLPVNASGGAGAVFATEPPRCMKLSQEPAWADEVTTSGAEVALAPPRCIKLSQEPAWADEVTMLEAEVDDEADVSAGADGGEVDVVEFASLQPASSIAQMTAAVLMVNRWMNVLYLL